MSDLRPNDDESALPPAPGDEPLAAESGSSGGGRSRGLRIAVVAAIVVGLLAVSGAAAAFFMFRGSPEVVLDKIPASADVVVVVHLDPAASQKMNLFRMTEKFPDLGSRDELATKLQRALDESLGDTGLTHEDLAWVGGEAGGFVTIGAGSPSYAILIASKDDGAASGTLETLRSQSSATYHEAEIQGIDAWISEDADQPTTAIVDHVVVLASDENALRSVIDTFNGGSAIADDATFTKVMDQLPKDNLGFAYANVGNVVSLLGALPSSMTGLPAVPEQLSSLQALGYAVSAEPDGLAIDGVTVNDESKLTQQQRDDLAAGDGPNALLDLVPADAFAVIASGGIGSQLQHAAEQIGQLDPSSAREVERWDLLGPRGLLTHLTGETAVQVGPGQGLLPVEATALIGVDDADAVHGWLDRHLPKVFGMAHAHLPLQTEEHNGVTITYTDPLSGAPPVAWGVADGAVVVGLSAKSVEEAVDLSQGAPSISSDPGFQQATSGLPGTESVVYIDVGSILTTVQNIVPEQAYNDFLANGGRDVQPITLVVAGGESDEHGSRNRILIAIP